MRSPFSFQGATTSAGVGLKLKGRHRSGDVTSSHLVSDNIPSPIGPPQSQPPPQSLQSLFGRSAFGAPGGGAPPPKSLLFLSPETAGAGGGPSGPSRAATVAALAAAAAAQQQQQQQVQQQRRKTAPVDTSKFGRPRRKCLHFQVYPSDNMYGECRCIDFEDGGLLEQI